MTGKAFLALVCRGSTTLDEQNEQNSEIDAVGVRLADEVLAEIDSIYLRYPNPAV